MIRSSLTALHMALESLRQDVAGVTDSDFIDDSSPPREPSEPSVTLIPGSKALPIVLD